MPSVVLPHRWRPRRLRQDFKKPISFGNSPWQWWISHDRYAETFARRMDAFLNQGQDGHDVETLRTFKGRSTYRIHGEHGDAFAKRIPLLTLRKRFGALTGHQNSLLGFDHGSAEVTNALAMHERTSHGLPVFCMGERLSYGVPHQQLLIQPWLDGTIGLGELWHSTSSCHRQQLLLRVEELLASLHGARLFHMDLHHGNIMIDPDDATSTLHAIDCDKMVVDVARPELATALHIGKLLRELEGREPEHFLRQLSLARHMQRRITGKVELSEEVDALLAVSLRYRMSKTISRRRLLISPFNTIEGRKLEARARRTYKNRDMPLINWQDLQMPEHDVDCVIPSSL
ncbi:hypothetical protein ACUN8C_15215 [Kushneria sp. Sum13]|uniref:hypothetical protein n=1 Tax=Kushneria sp. Sum13 TaxID=3459196 RepID=UPI00404664D0